MLNFLTENKENRWTSIIKEELGVENNNKLQWMSEYAAVHELYEGLQPNTNNVSQNIYATPLNTMGMGDPTNPAVAQSPADFHSQNYLKGSGDVPMSTLTMALTIAAMTIGLELVPVIPSKGPWAMLSYMDTPYAGGKLGRKGNGGLETPFDGIGPDTENKPIYIKVKYNVVYASGKTKKDFEVGNDIVFTNGTKVFTGSFLGFSRIDNGIIVKVVSALDGSDNCSIADVFEGQVTLSSTAAAAVLGTQTAQLVSPQLVAGNADHIQSFGNFYNGSDEPMTRAQNETGVGNTIGARMFTKLVQMGAYEVTGTVTRQQLQDMPLYGIDVVGKVLEAMQNEISQEINNRILDRVFKLGVTNAVTQKEYQGVDLNLYFGNAGAPATKALSSFSAASKFVGIDGTNAATNWGNVNNAVQNTAAENTHTLQRRIMSRMLAAANLIANVSRWGRGSWAVTNTQVLSALQDAAGFVIAPMTNSLVQDGSKSLYFAGSVAGLSLYVDPYMTWDDTRVCVGRKSDGNSPGVIFMPYILADTVQITAEGTMAPKLLCNSRFAIIDAGFYPEQSYYTFMVDANGVDII